MFQIKLNNSVFEIGDSYIKKDGVAIHKESLLDFVKSPFFADQSPRAFSGKVREVVVNKTFTSGAIPNIRWNLNCKEFTIAELYFLVDVCEEKELYNVNELKYFKDSTYLLINEDLYLIEDGKEACRYGNFKVRDILSAKFNKENFVGKVNKSVEYKTIYGPEIIGMSRAGKENKITGDSMKGKVITHISSDHIGSGMKYLDYLDLLDEMKKHLKQTFMEMSRRASNK